MGIILLRAINGLQAGTDISADEQPGLPRKMGEPEHSAWDCPGRKGLLKDQRKPVLSWSLEAE